MSIGLDPTRSDASSLNRPTHFSALVQSRPVMPGLERLLPERRRQARDAASAASRLEESRSGSVPAVSRREPGHAQEHDRAPRVETDDLDEIAIVRNATPARNGSSPTSRWPTNVTSRRRATSMDCPRSRAMSPSGTKPMLRPGASAVTGGGRRRRADGAAGRGSTAGTADAAMVDCHVIRALGQRDAGRHVVRKRRQRDVADQGGRERARQEPGSTRATDWSAAQGQAGGHDRRAGDEGSERRRRWRRVRQEPGSPDRARRPAASPTTR